MKVKRTQEQRSAATRRALIDAARTLWAERGYAGVGTPEIVAAAGVTRGAMYHQFGDKAALFLAVIEEVERDLTQRLATGVAATSPADPAAALHAAVDAWLEACSEVEVRQLVLLDAPVVLGWAAFRDVALRHGLGLTEIMLSAAIEQQQLPALPTRTLAHILIGALDEAAWVVAAAAAADERAARLEAAEVLHALLNGLLQRG